MTTTTTNNNLLDLEDDPTPSAPLEIIVLTIPECFVYKVPPLRSASGHRAEDWDLANPLFTGCLRIYQADVKLRIVIYAFKDPKRQVVTDENIILFGECPIEIKPNESVTNYVDGVIDSSRYYVVRIKDPKSTRTTNIGIGFRDRDPAFDLKNSLNEYTRYVDRSKLAEKFTKFGHHATQPPPDHLTGDGMYNIQNEEFEDFLIHDQTKELPPLTSDHVSPLKEGEKIKVKLQMKSKKSEEEEVNHSQSLLHHETQKPTTTKGFLLKPPPPPGTIITANNSRSEPPMNQSDNNNNTNDEEWGDFSTGV